MMKYTANHDWKFETDTIAFISGFLQVTAAVFIELVNYAVIETAPDLIELA